jgi:flagellar biosynthesis protein FlhG
MRILPIASGKGGVGKSLVAANLSLALAQAGKQVIVVDLDLGGSNIHQILGQSGIKKGIGVFLSSQKTSFEDIIIDTEYKNLRFIPGDAEIPGTANLKSTQKRMLLSRLRKLEADYCIIDLGAGTNFNILDFFLISGTGIIVTSPTPTANLNAYLFLKNLIFRVLHSSIDKKSKAFQILEKLNETAATYQGIYVPRLLEEIKNQDPKSFAKFEERLRGFHPKLILNLLEDPKDGNKAAKLRRSCKEYLNVDMEHLGIIYRDDLQDVALQSKIPILIYKPNSVLSQAIYRIADKLLQEPEDEEYQVDFSTIQESFQTAEMEAEVDFDMKMRYMEDLLHCGALTQGDLIETIKNQQLEISRLKKENNVIKSKLAKAMGAGFLNNE